MAKDRIQINLFAALISAIQQVSRTIYKPRITVVMDEDKYKESLQLQHDEARNNSDEDARREQK